MSELKCYKNPSHVDNTDGDMYSVVFDQGSPGKELARFYGEGHREMSEFFVAAWNQRVEDK